MRVLMMLIASLLTGTAIVVWFEPITENFGNAMFCMAVSAWSFTWGIFSRRT